MSYGDRRIALKRAQNNDMSGKGRTAFEEAVADVAATADVDRDQAIKVAETGDLNFIDSIEKRLAFQRAVLDELHVRDFDDGLWVLRANEGFDFSTLDT